MEEKLFRKCIFDIKPYVPGKPISEVQRELNLENVIKLASNENLLGPSPLAINRMREKLNEINYYPHSDCYYLRKKLAGKLGVGEENLVFGSGADELIHHLMLLFVSSGDEVIVPTPSFVMYEIAAKVMEGKVIKVELKNFKYDLIEIKKRISGKTKLIFICSPNNPTGTIVEIEELEKFIRDIPENIFVVFDEAYKEYVESEKYPETINFLNEGHNVVILRTFSKIYGLAGLRIGYGITLKEVVEAINKVRGPFNVNSLAQEAALSALDDVEHLRRSRALVLEGKKFLYENLSKLGIEYVPTEANFILINVKKSGNEVFQSLLKRGVIVRPGEVLGVPGYIRVTIGLKNDNEKFIEALREVI